MRCFFFLFERLKVNDLYDEKSVCCVCTGALGLASLFAAVFERPTLRGCQRWGALCRVKPLCNLTLPCQKTNPDGVILDGNEWKMGFRKPMDYLRWAFVGSKHRRMAMEARGNGLQKINVLSSMGFCR